MILTGELEILLLGFKSRAKVNSQLFEARDGWPRRRAISKTSISSRFTGAPVMSRSLGSSETPPVDVAGGWKEHLEAQAANDLVLLLLLVL
jgi:hypothetical protein